MKKIIFQLLMWYIVCFGSNSYADFIANTTSKIPCLMLNAATGAKILSGTVYINIKNNTGNADDGKYWSGTAWAVSATNLTMTHSNSGVWIYSWGIPSSLSGQIEVVCWAASESSVVRGGWIDVYPETRLILGSNVGINLNDITQATDPTTLTNITVPTVTSVTNGVTLAATATSPQLVDDIWDEVLTGATHNVSTSAGKLLRLISSVTSIDGTVNDAAATTTYFISNLSNAVTDFYKDSVIVITSGDLIGQARPISAYNGTTKRITVDEAWTSAPANTVAFTILSTHVHPVTQISAAVWDELSTGHTDAGKAGQQLWTDVDAIKTKTDYLPSATAGAAGGVFIAGSNAATSITTALTANITGNLSGSVGSVTGAVGSVTAGVTLANDAITAAKIAAGAIGNDEFNVTERYWPVYNVINLTNESGDQNPTTTTFDTDFVATIDITLALEPLIYFPTTGEEPTQDAACNVMEIGTKITAYNTTTKVVTVDALPVAPDYRCKFWRY